MEQRSVRYAQILSSLIQAETISVYQQKDMSKFYQFQDLLVKTFPVLFSKAEKEDFNGSFVLRIKGKSKDNPILFMNHLDVVEAKGEWAYPPFSGIIADGKVWGRGTLDTKGGLFAMMQAAEELLSDGYEPENDIYFMSTCTEEVGGEGGDIISKAFEDRNLKFSMVLDEGGMVVSDPIAGAKGEYAMIGVGEKGCTDLKFIAKSSGGHASTPSKNSPLIRLAKFMVAVEKKNLFKAYMSPTVCEMFSRISKSMKGGMRFILGRSRFFKPVLVKILPKVSNAANAMLKTTIAFTMASGSDGANVMPREAFVIGNMRFSHHQGRDESIRAITKLAKKYGIETHVQDAGFQSPLSPHDSEYFKLVERAIQKVYPHVRTTPYIMTGASDCRFMSRVSENCLRFTPFIIDNKQLNSIHGVDENVNVSSLAPAVDFYKYVITEKK